MKKIFTLIAAAFLAASANAQTVIYSWESPEGEPIEVGGKMTHLMGSSEGSRLNYANSNAKADVVEATQSYYTICLNGKKANINDATPADKDASSRMELALDQELADGDKFTVTGYYNKGAEKKVSMYMLFDNGKDYTSALFANDISQVVDGTTTPRTAAEPETKEFTVDGIAGCKSLKMTRSDAGTNLFITKFVISREGSTAIKNVNAAAAAKTVKAIENGQLVIKSAKGTFNVAGAQMK